MSPSALRDGSSLPAGFSREPAEASALFRLIRGELATFEVDPFFISQQSTSTRKPAKSASGKAQSLIVAAHGELVTAWPDSRRFSAANQRNMDTNFPTK